MRFPSLCLGLIALATSLPMLAAAYNLAIHVAR